MDKSPDQWHSIRPWIRRFALSVDHVSSVSATFTLKSALTARSLDLAFESLLEDEQDESPCASVDRTDSCSRFSTVSDALTHGLSVKVNSTPWQRVLLRVDEESDEAIIIVFGLMPGRQYDIELGVANPQEAIRSQVVTDGSSPDRTDPSSNLKTQDQSDANGSTVAASSPDNAPSRATPPPISTPSSRSSSSSPPVPSPAPSSSELAPSMTLEERVQQLNQTLSLLQSERDSLAASLKSTRRDAQRADAAIRADIETLKRTSDKFASVEHRARQKVLALQETVKQTLAAADDINASVTEVENSLPALHEQQDEAEKECQVAKQQAAQAREERETLERQEKKRIENLQTELAGLGCKLEKLNSKREKLETSVIPELEEELRKIEEEIAAVTAPSPPATDQLLDSHHPGTASSNRPASPSALPNLAGFSDDLHTTSQDSLPGPIENLRRRKYLSHPLPALKHQQPQTQKQVQILRPSHQPPHQARPSLIGNKSPATSSTSTSTLSSLAIPFEPSPKRQAQLQSTLGAPLNPGNIASGLKSELNPTSSIFAPRMGFTTSSTSSASISTSASHQSAGASPTPGQSAWVRGNQKSRRSDVG